MTLEMFMDNDFTPMNDTHIATLTKLWKEIDISDKLYQFNKNWHMDWMANNLSDAELSYRLNLNIPHYSKWASQVLKDRAKGA